MQHRLAGDAEQLRGLAERHVAFGHLGAEAASDLFREPDPPGRVRRHLLGPPTTCSNSVASVSVRQEARSRDRSPADELGAARADAHPKPADRTNSSGPIEKPAPRLGSTASKRGLLFSLLARAIDFAPNFGPYGCQKLNRVESNANAGDRVAQRPMSIATTGIADGLLSTLRNNAHTVRRRQRLRPTDSSQLGMSRCHRGR
jgi:hypothetical protein